MKFLLITVGFVVGAGTGYGLSVMLRGYRERIVETQQPLQFVTEEGSQAKYMLPPGTTLYFDATDSKANFTRYFVYVNVEGKAFDLHPTEHSWYIAPLLAKPME